MSQQAHNPEEVDIVQFFKAIGQMFNNLFRAIKKLFLSIFYLLLDLLLYVKKYYIYFAGVVLIGLVIAFFKHQNQQNLFSASVVVKANYDAQVPLQEKLDFFNSLISDKKFDLLAKSLGVPSKQAQSYVNFEMTPELNDIFLIEDYERRIMDLDTVVYKFFEYKDYKKSVNRDNSLFPYWKIEVVAKNPDVFSVLNEKLGKILNDNEKLVQRKNNYVSALKLSKEKVLKSLSEIDSLRNVFNTVMLESAKNSSSGSTNIVVSNDRVRGPEAPYNLFYTRTQELKNLDKYTKKADQFNDILILKNRFPTYGEKQSGFLYNVYIRYPLLGILFLFLILFAIDFNTYLNKYQKSKENID